MRILYNRILVFPESKTLAFGAFMPAIVAGQFMAKVVGGAVWSLIIAKVQAPKEQEA